MRSHFERAIVFGGGCETGSGAGVGWLSAGLFVMRQYLLPDGGIELVQGPPVVRSARDVEPVGVAVVALSIKNVGEGTAPRTVGLSDAVADLAGQLQLVLCNGI